MTATGFCHSVFLGRNTVKLGHPNFTSPFGFVTACQGRCAPSATEMCQLCLRYLSYLGRRPAGSSTALERGSGRRETKGITPDHVRRESERRRQHSTVDLGWIDIQDFQIE